MAKERIVNTRFWADSYVANLDPIEKLLFLYLITNQYTEISGIYELPIKYMSVDTGIEKDMVEKILKRFEKDGKAVFVDGWVKITNFSRYQNSKNKKVQIGIENALARVPNTIKDKLSISYVCPMDSTSHSNSNSNSNSNLNPNLNIPTQQEVEEYFVGQLYPKECGSSFWANYNSIGWIDGQNRKIKDWKSRVPLWMNNQKQFESNKNGSNRKDSTRGSIDFDKYAAEREASKPKGHTGMVSDPIQKRIQ